MSEDKRKVSRVLVMLDYGPEDSQSGEVFDLTALVHEIASRPGIKHNNASITMEIDAVSDYSAERTEDQKSKSQWPIKVELGWRASIAFDRSGRAAHLDDAINSAMPDSFATQDLRKRLRKIHNKAEKLSEDISIQRLRDAAAIRHTHPIARVTETPVLADIAKAQP